MASRAVYVGRDLLPSVAAAGREFGWSPGECKALRQRLHHKGRVWLGKVPIFYAVEGRRTRGGGEGQTMIDCELRRQVRREEKSCVVCGSRKRLEVDHIIPVAAGGSDLRENLQLLCRPCHEAKSAEESRGRNPSGASPPKPISIPGFGDFPSVHAASKATGFDRQVLRRRRDAGTLHELATARRGQPAGIALMKPLWIAGGPQPSRRAAADALGTTIKRISMRLDYGESAWDLTIYRETWRWRKLEEETIGDGANCVRCGKRATRAVHTETWIDLSTSPFTLPVDPVCRSCEHVIHKLRRPEIKEANADWVRRCFPVPEVTEKVREEQRRIIAEGKCQSGAPVIVDGNLFANFAQAQAHYGSRGLWRAIKVGRKWLRLEVRMAEPDEYEHLIPAVPPKVLEEQRRLVLNPPRGRGGHQRAIPVLVNGDLFASGSEACRYFKRKGIHHALALGRRFAGRRVEYAPPELIAELKGGGS